MFFNVKTEQHDFSAFRSSKIPSFFHSDTARQDSFQSFPALPNWAKNGGTSSQTDLTERASWWRPTGIVNCWPGRTKRKNLRYDSSRRLTSSGRYRRCTDRLWNRPLHGFYRSGSHGIRTAYRKDQRKYPEGSPVVSIFFTGRRNSTSVPTWSVE